MFWLGFAAGVVACVVAAIAFVIYMGIKHKS